MCDKCKYKVLCDDCKKKLCECACLTCSKCASPQGAGKKISECNCK